MEKQPMVCNKFVAPGCEPFASCGYPVDDLSGINKNELVAIYVELKKRYDIQGAPHTLRKIKAMRKVLKHFGLYEEYAEKAN